MITYILITNPLLPLTRRVNAKKLNLKKVRGTK